MRITAFDIWLIGTLDGLVVLFAISLIVSSVITFLLCMNSCGTKEERKSISIAAGISAFLAVALVMTPTSKTACAMIVLPAVVNSEVVQNLPKDVVEYAKDWLKSNTVGDGK